MSILIVFINSIGGIIIGMVQGGRRLASLSIYIVATVGNGLVSRYRRAAISTATGMLMTRAASVSSLSEDIKTQIISYPVVLLITGAVVLALS